MSVFAMVLAFSSSAIAQGRDLPIQYEVRFFAAPIGNIFRVEDANNSGKAVGSFRIDLDNDGLPDARRAFLYDSDAQPSGVARDLNSLVNNLPAGMAIRNATAINEWGDIAANVELISFPRKPLHAAMIDMSATPAKIFFVPDGDIAGHSQAADLNDFGDLVAKYQPGDGSIRHYVYNVGLYDPLFATNTPVDVGVAADNTWPSINNSLEVVGAFANGRAYRVTLGGTVKSFPDLGPALSLNDRGEFCGGMLFAANTQGAKATRYSYICWGSAPEELKVSEHTDGYGAVELNQAGDTVSGRALNHRERGTYYPAAMLTPSYPSTVVWQDTVIAFELSALTDRDSTEFPTLFGNATRVDGSRCGFAMFPSANK